MEIRNVDLYKVFDKERQTDARGFLRSYQPEITKDINADRTHPAVLIIPGGGYGYVSPREAEPIALRYLAKGFAAYILDYSVAPFKYPTAFLEASMAMLYLRDNCNSLALNKERIAAIGFSAGGHLCGCLATLFDDEIINDNLGNVNDKVRPDAVILSYPVITSGIKSHRGSFDNLCGNDEDLKKKLSLENCVTKNSAPAFIWHTFEDGAVPVLNSLLIAQAYESQGVPFNLHIYEKGGHGVSTADLSSNHADKLPDVSTSLKGWVDMSIDWLIDRGFTVKDK